MNRLEGGLGAILDEMRKASEELINVIKNVSKESFIKIVDSKTADEDCRSIQTVCRHVIRSGYGYVNYISAALKLAVEFPAADKLKMENSEDAAAEIRRMVEFNIHYLYEMNGYKIEENMFSIKFNSRMNEEYNFEQILEHAVVHILRHRRQIEKFISLMKT